MIDPEFYEGGDPMRWRLAIRVVVTAADTNVYGDIFASRKETPK